MIPYRPLRKKLVFSFGGSDTQKSANIYLEGKLHHVHVRVPDFANAVTAGVAVADPDGYAYLEETSLAENQNHNLVFAKEVLLLGEGGTVKVTLSGAPGGAGGEVIVALYYFGVGESG
ncbi:MAG: hypothetical protein QME75_10570 [Deltaproteobacteria bacterium]|nr:hypothetical protein [Deltaproteobacteria bacterium]